MLYEIAKPDLDYLPFSRLYYDIDDGDDVLVDLCEMACRDPNLDLCFIRDLPGTPIVDASGVFAMNWRFFPTLDPQVSYVIYVSFSLGCPLK